MRVKVRKKRQSLQKPKGWLGDQAPEGKDKEKVQRELDNAVFGEFDILAWQKEKPFVEPPRLKKAFFDRKRNKIYMLIIRRWRKPFRYFRYHLGSLKLLRFTLSHIIGKTPGSAFSCQFHPYKVNFSFTYFEKFLQWLDWRIPVIAYRLRIFQYHNLRILNSYLLKGVLKVNQFPVSNIEYRVTLYDFLAVCYVLYFRYRKEQLPWPGKENANWYYCFDRLLTFLLIRFPLFQDQLFDEDSDYDEGFLYYGKRMPFDNIIYLTYFA